MRGTQNECCVSMLRKLGNICCGHKMFLDKSEKHFLCPGHKICVRNKCCARGQTGKHLCRQQCDLARALCGNSKHFWFWIAKTIGKSRFSQRLGFPLAISCLISCFVSKKIKDIYFMLAHIAQNCFEHGKLFFVNSFPHSFAAVSDLANRYHYLRNFCILIGWLQW